MPENTTPKQARGRFSKGISGNPSGKPRGARHKATLAAEALLDGDAQTLTRKAIELAKNGDVTALRLCMDRILPPRKGRPVSFDLPKVETAGDVVTAIGAVIASVAGGELTPDEGSLVATLLETKRKAIETLEIEARLRALEGKA